MVFDAWIVGTGADMAKDPADLADWDVMIPYKNWHEAAALIPEDTKPNTFGGWKCYVGEGLTIDVWPGSLDELFEKSFMKYAWHPKSGTRLIKL